MHLTPPTRLCSFPRSRPSLRSPQRPAAGPRHRPGPPPSTAPASSSVTAARRSRTRPSWSPAAGSPQVGPSRQGHRAGRRGAGEPGRQDRDADHRRHPRAPEHDARAAGRRPAPPRLFRRQRGDEPGARPAGRPVPGARPARRRGPPATSLAGRGITMPEQGRTDVPYWVTSEAEARKAVQEQAALKVDFIKIWVDDRDGKYQKMPPPIYTAGDRRGPQGQAAGRRPHLQPVGRQGPAQGRPRRLRPRHPRRRRRRRSAWR